MPPKSDHKARLRDVGSVLYSLDIIHRRIQRWRMTSFQQSMQRVGETYADLTVVQMQVLLSVMAHQPVTIKRLAELRNITSSAATQAVDILVNKGFLTREQDENDRRSTLISLSPEYQQRVSDFMQNVGSNFDAVFKMLNNKEIADLAQLCEKIVAEGENV